MSLKLLILGLLMERDMHPYEIRQLMKERHLLDYIKIKDGSLYYAVDQLKKDERIDVVGVVKASSRPDRTIYRITDSGRELFQELLLQQFSLNKVIEHPLFSALPFAAHGDQTQIAKLIGQKLELSEQRAAEMRAVYEEHVGTVPKSALHLMAGIYMHVQTDVRWLRRLLQDAREGQLSHVGESWDLDDE